MTGPKLPSRDKRAIGVLVVEQEPLLHPLLRMALEPHGFELKLSSNLNDGLDMLYDNKQALQILLIAGSVIGDSAEKIIKAFWAIQPVLAVVVMTGDFVTHDPEPLIKLGVAQVIRKPFSVADLVHTVKQAAASLGSEKPADGDTPSAKER